MGSRHNRKRTRSRPRNRLASKSSSFTYQDLPYQSIPSVSALPNHQRPASYWQQQYAVWQARQSLAHQGLAQRRDTNIASLDQQRMRMFGGSVEDEESLCAPMLQVVLDLFNGSIDYEDP